MKPLNIRVRKSLQSSESLTAEEKWDRQRKEMKEKIKGKSKNK